MILHVWFKPHATKPEDSAAGRFHIVEVPAKTFDEACTAIGAEGLIRGEFLHSRFTGDGVRTVHRREAFAFQGSAIDRIQPSPWNFVDEVTA